MHNLTGNETGDSGGLHQVAQGIRDHPFSRPIFFSSAWIVICLILLAAIFYAPPVIRAMPEQWLAGLFALGLLTAMVMNLIAIWSSGVALIHSFTHKRLVTALALLPLQAINVLAVIFLGPTAIGMLIMASFIMLGEPIKWQ